MSDTSKENNNPDMVISYADLNQFQFTYNTEEDRILINFQTTQNQHYRAWFSRLFVSKIWAVFLQILKQNPVLSPLSLDNPKEELKRDDKHVEKLFEHKDDIAPQVEFWGEETEILLHTLHIDTKNNGTLEIRLLNKTGQGIVMHLSYSLFQIFCGLIVQTVTSSHWDLQLENADWVINLNPETSHLESLDNSNLVIN